MTEHNPPKPPHPPKTGNPNYLKDFENFLELYLVKKAPALPEGLKDFLVTVAPWLAVIAIVITLPLILAILGVSTFFTGMGIVIMPMGGFYGLSSVSLVLTAVIMVLEIIAIPGLFSRKKRSWNLMFYATILSFISNVIFSMTAGGIIMSVLGVYVLFQVKSHYKN